MSTCKFFPFPLPLVTAILSLTSAGIIRFGKAIKLLTYMNLLKSPKGILFNFNVVNLYKEGQETFVPFVVFQLNIMIDKYIYFGDKPYF